MPRRKGDRDKKKRQISNGLRRDAYVKGALMAGGGLAGAKAGYNIGSGFGGIAGSMISEAKSNRTGIKPKSNYAQLGHAAGAGIGLTGGLALGAGLGYGAYKTYQALGRKREQNGR